MPVWKQRLVTAFLAALIAAHAYATVTATDHWPLCSYPMFSWLVEDRAVIVYRAVGVSADGADEVHLNVDSELPPFDQARLAWALQRASSTPDANKRLPIALNSLLQTYEQRRLAGAHAGPPLRAIRLYAMRFSVDPRRADRDRPEQRLLIGSSEIGASP